MPLQQLRRTPRTRQQHRNETPASEAVEDTPTEEPPESADEETRPSSDLEDCPELWWSELGNYIIETHKRQKQVDAWFSRWIIVSTTRSFGRLHAHGHATLKERDSITAYRMSHHYRDRLARIPPPPPPLPPPPPVDEQHLLLKMGAPSPSSDYEIGHPDFHASDSITFVGEDGGRDFVDSIQSSRRKGKGKGKEAAKRPPVAASDSDSDLDIPMSAMRPPQKKRRLDKDGAIVAEDQRSVDEPISVSSPAHKLLVNARGKGKGKQREQSADSVSATPRGRKKPGPRKNLPPATQGLLGISSGAPSVSGEVTPSASRPPSPALTSVSATLYELDEAIPPLKKARKVDDAAMAKRVKNLEEAQRKVWMNIARRDVAKVRFAILH